MASKLTTTDISNIANQGAVRSSPLRNNFTALKNKINEVIDALAAAAIGTTNAETTAARPYHASLLDRLDSMWKGQYNFVKSGGVVSLNSNPQKVDISSGEAKVDGADVVFASATSGTIAYTVSNTRYDVVVVNSDSTITVVTGTAHATPKFPALATSQKALAVLLVTTSAITIHKAMSTVTDDDAFDGNKYPSYFPRGTSHKQVFTSSGTWYKPSNVTQAKVTLIGAGGAGGAGGYGIIDYGYSGGGGGGAGAVINVLHTCSSDIAITVGATGDTVFDTITAKCGVDGTDGSNVSAAGGTGGAGGGALGIGNYSIAGGAGGGDASAGGAGGYGAGGGGGGGSGAAGAKSGGVGGVGLSFVGGVAGVKGTGAGNIGSGGGGGAGCYGSEGGAGGNGGAAGAVGSAGADAAGYGAGGGGGGGVGSGGANSGAGGAGGPGLCIVEWEE